MTDQWAPGWYDDGHGQQRWWDGRGWTAHTRPIDADAEVATSATDVVATATPIEAALTRAQS
uniref:DUF2510 domain-containing protein n=1 Tax=uncultured Amnibacterium sp. TaxID=1631851 RepID=UPI0035CC3EB4